LSVLSFDSAGAEPFSLVLERWQDNLGDARPAFEAMAQYQVKTVNGRQFREEGSVETGKWAPLSKDYGRWKARVRPGRKIMVFDGDLKRSMTVPGKGIYIVRSTSMTVGTSVPYAIYHQKGTPMMPARPLIGAPRKKDTRQLGKILQRWIVESRAEVSA
jgi:phage gpG-like protein